MQVAREFSNSPTLGDMTQSKVFALLDLPQEEREEFVTENNIDEMTTRQLQQAIKEKKQAEARIKVIINNVLYPFGLAYFQNSSESRLSEFSVLYPFGLAYFQNLK
jgi:hypothetical protein